MRELLDKDPTLFCISAWNDNGRESHVKNSETLYRTHFFPGLGWMISDKVWREWEDKWPSAYWDDWVREPNQRNDRSCIYPEIPRTFTFGFTDGVSTGQFAKKFLKAIILNDQPIDWRTKNITYLMQSQYDEEFFRKIVYEAIQVNENEVDSFTGSTLYLEYGNNANRVKLCRKFQLMEDEKAGVPRTAYYGVITFWRGTNYIYLAPQGTKENFEKKLHERMECEQYRNKCLL
eukprot:TRINITY_DN5109_c0_g1_i2.p1 TRINITY_DN5109_c0_g1~~TRINITY_DN5109_c0_g1_i2.p1  ORF type:complete len:233 (-),score=24.82 TRINITY_DN5109_c0_g1_i2:65-763(-)